MRRSSQKPKCMCVGRDMSGIEVGQKVWIVNTTIPVSHQIGFYEPVKAGVVVMPVTAGRVRIKTENEFGNPVIGEYDEKVVRTSEYQALNECAERLNEYVRTSHLTISTVLGNIGRRMAIAGS